MINTSLYLLLREVNSNRRLRDAIDAGNPPEEHTAFLLSEMKAAITTAVIAKSKEKAKFIPSRFPSYTSVTNPLETTTQKGKRQGLIIRAPSKPTYKHICEFAPCGKIFDRTNNNAKYCSAECRFKERLRVRLEARQEAARRREESKPKHTCASCPATIDKLRKFCDACNHARLMAHQAARRERAKAAGVQTTGYELACTVCLVLYIARRKDGRYCSQECVNASRRSTQPETLSPEQLEKRRQQYREYDQYRRGKREAKPLNQCTCHTCGAGFENRCSSAKFCCNACRRVDFSKRARLKKRAEGAKASGKYAAIEKPETL